MPQTDTRTTVLDLTALDNECFPSTLTFFRLDNGEELFSIAMSGPGHAEIPELGDYRTMGSFIEFASGEYSFYVPQVGVDCDW